MAVGLDTELPPASTVAPGVCSLPRRADVRMRLCYRPLPFPSGCWNSVITGCRDKHPLPQRPCHSSSNGERGPPLALDNWGASPTCVQGRRLKLGERAAARGGRVRRVLLPRAGDDEVDEACVGGRAPQGTNVPRRPSPGRKVSQPGSCASPTAPTRLRPPARVLPLPKSSGCL